MAGIRAASVGESLISPTIASKVLQRVRATSSVPAIAETIRAELSDREIEVLKLIANGKDNAHDRGRAPHLPEDGQEPHLEHPDEAADRQPHPGGCLRGAKRDRLEPQAPRTRGPRPRGRGAREHPAQPRESASATFSRSASSTISSVPPRCARRRGARRPPRSAARSASAPPRARAPPRSRTSTSPRAGRGRASSRSASRASISAKIGFCFGHAQSRRGRSSTSMGRAQIGNMGRAAHLRRRVRPRSWSSWRASSVVSSSRAGAGRARPCPSRSACAKALAVPHVPASQTGAVAVDLGPARRSSR